MTQNLTLGYMTKTLNQIIFFFSNIGNQNIFLEKKHNPPPPPPPLQVKWSFPKENTSTMPAPPFKLNGHSLKKTQVQCQIKDRVNTHP